MTRIEEMMARDVRALLSRAEYGHLACCRDDRPYLVPIHFAYTGTNLYLFTTEGMKTEIIRTNPHVCLQAEEVEDSRHWKSVIVGGRVEHLTSEEDKAFALTLIKRDAPPPVVLPVLHTRYADPHGRERTSVIYRLHPDYITGRETVG